MKGGGEDSIMFQKFWGTFGLNIGQMFGFWSYTKVTSGLSKMGRYKSYLTGVQNGVEAILDNVQNIDFSLFSLSLSIFKNLFDSMKCPQICVYSQLD